MDKSILFCRHERTRKKLTAIAISMRGVLYQGFEYRTCCLNCGKLV